MAELIPNTKLAYEQLAWKALLREDLGSHNLKEAKKDLDQIKKIFDDILPHLNSADLPDLLVQDMETVLREFFEFAEEVRTFGDTRRRYDFINRIRNEKYQIIQKTARFKDYINLVGSREDKKLKDAEEQARELLDEIKGRLNDAKKAEELLQSAQAEKKKAEELLQSAQIEKQKQEAEKFVTFFGDEAKKNKLRALINFGAMIGCIVATAVVAYFFYDSISFAKDGQVDYGMLVSNVLLKFFGLSLGAFLIAHFSKGHAAEQHLYNLNTQRQNALNSHRAILDSVMATDSDNEKEVKNLILLELTKAIFDSKDTGYIKSNEKGSLNISLPQIKT